MPQKTAEQVPVHQAFRSASSQAAVWLLLVAACWGLAGAIGLSARAQPADPLAQARRLYNQHDYDGAIAAAEKAQGLPGLADAASLVAARARLERYRAAGDRADLVAGREALLRVQPERLSPRDRAELLVGLGESLFLEGLHGAAAELFETALARADLLGPAGRGQLLDWWATALDREAQSRPPIDRDAAYGRILSRMSDELTRDPDSPAAWYWLASASRSTGDVNRAWDAAVAGWVRAAFAGDRGPALRADLDRLMVEAIIPERARLQAPSLADRERVASELKEEWETIKKTWSR